jgi:hypothetical protein
MDNDIDVLTVAEEAIEPIADEDLEREASLQSQGPTGKLTCSGMVTPFPC